MDIKLNIINEQVRDRAARIVSELELETVHQVVVKPLKITRTLAQNALYWEMLGHLQKHSETGYTSDNFHEDYKSRFLVRIYVRNPERHQVLVSSIEAIEAVMAKGLIEQAKVLWTNTLKSLSTTEANTAEFTEYLKAIEHDMRETYKVVLPAKDDIYNKAMGIK